MHSYMGYCRTQLDCLILFEAACMGIIPRISQRLTEEERSEIKSGSIYIWDENEAGVKRWTDGKSWSTSRVSGPFLIYRELEPSSQGSSRCQVKTHGLCKQSASITVGENTKLHLIAYYRKDDVRAGSLMQPSTDMRFKEITAFLKKRNISLTSPDSATPLPLSPPASMHQVKTAAVGMQGPAGPAGAYSVMYAAPQVVHHMPPQMHMAHPHQHMFAPIHPGPPSPPYASQRGPTPPMTFTRAMPSPPPAPVAFQPQPPMPQQQVLQQPQHFVYDQGRAFDEDRRQLSLLDKSLSAY